MQAINMKSAISLLLAVFTACAAAQQPVASASSTTLLELSAKAKTKFMGAAALALPALGPAVSNVHFSRYADPFWDKKFAGTPDFWMGLARGGCSYGNKLNSNVYPYLMGLSLSGPTRKALGINTGVGCGACVRISCDPNGYQPYCNPGQNTVVGVVLDICPEFDGHSSGNVCQQLHGDMYIKGWQEVGNIETSNPKTIMQRVQCPDPETNIQLYVLENNGPWQFLKIVFQNVAGSGVIADVDWACDGVHGPEFTKLSGAAWQVNNQPKSVEWCSFKLTLDDGTVVQTPALRKFKTGKWNDATGTGYPDIVDTQVQVGKSWEQIVNGLGGGRKMLADFNVTGTQMM